MEFHRIVFRKLKTEYFWGGGEAIWCSIRCKHSMLKWGKSPVCSIYYCIINVAFCWQQFVSHWCGCVCTMFIKSFNFYRCKKELWKFNLDFILQKFCITYDIVTTSLGFLSSLAILSSYTYWPFCVLSLCSTFVVKLLLYFQIWTRP